MDLRLPTTKWVKLQYIFCVSLSFLAIFFLFFGKILGFLSLIYCILCLLSIILGIFSGIQDGDLPVAPIGE